MNRQPELYRTPKKPGYLGGYNWRATCFGLLLLLVVNFAATQFIAARFDYQPALGRPLLRSKRGGGIYEPFAWVIWGWHNSTSQDPRVRKPLFEGEMIVFAGSFLCVGLFFSPRAGDRANSWRTPTISTGPRGGQPNRTSARRV